MKYSNSFGEIFPTDGRMYFAFAFPFLYLHFFRMSRVFLGSSDPVFRGLHAVFLCLWKTNRPDPHAIRSVNCVQASVAMNERQVSK